MEIFKRVCDKKPELLDFRTVHKLLALCCLISVKFYIDKYNPLGAYRILFEKKDLREEGLSINAGERFRAAECDLFLEVLEGNLGFRG